MDANTYQEAALRTLNCDAFDKPYSLLTDGVMGLCGESGECIDLVKKFLFQGHELDRDKLAEELGDVAWYLAVTAYAIGCPLDDVFRMNIDKLRKRYPKGFTPDQSINREEYRYAQD